MLNTKYTVFDNGEHPKKNSKGVARCEKAFINYVLSHEKPRSMQVVVPKILPDGCVWWQRRCCYTIALQIPQSLLWLWMWMWMWVVVVCCWCVLTTLPYLLFSSFPWLCFHPIQRPQEDPLTPVSFRPRDSLRWCGVRYSHHVRGM